MLAVMNPATTYVIGGGKGTKHPGSFIMIVLMGTLYP